jgi:hypothetical protein
VDRRGRSGAWNLFPPSISVREEPHPDEIPLTPQTEIVRDPRHRSKYGPRIDDPAGIRAQVGAAMIATCSFIEVIVGIASFLEALVGVGR